MAKLPRLGKHARKHMGRKEARVDGGDEVVLVHGRVFYPLEGMRFDENAITHIYI